MAAKKLINRTGAELDVTLIVRKGDLPEETAGAVNVVLEPGSEDESGHVQIVEYGSDTDIYLNGIEVKLENDGQVAATRRIVLQRGTPLDNELNTKNTIEFLYDGATVLFSGSETDLSDNSTVSGKRWTFTPGEFPED